MPRIAASLVVAMLVASCLGSSTFAAPAESAAPATGSQQPVVYRWRFRSDKAMEDGAFTSNAWKVGQLTHLVFRRKDHDSIDRQAFLKALQGKVLRIEYGGSPMACVKVVTTQDNGNEVMLVCQRLTGSKDEWHWNFNELYTIRSEDSRDEPVALAAVPKAPAVVNSPAPPASEVKPASPAQTPAAPAAAATAAATPAEQKTESYSWHFRSFETLQDGAFSTNAWELNQLSKFVFRRLDHQGEDRSTFLLGLSGKTLVIRDGNNVVTRAKITSMRDEGNQINFDCERLSPSAGSWQSNRVYTIEIDSTSSTPPTQSAAATAPAEKQPSHCFWRFRIAEVMQDGAFTANSWSVSELKVLVFRRIDHEGQDRSAFLLGLKGKTLIIRYGDRTLAGLKITGVSNDGNTIGLTCETLSLARTSWQYDKIYTILANDPPDASTQPAK